MFYLLQTNMKCYQNDPDLSHINNNIRHIDNTESVTYQEPKTLNFKQSYLLRGKIEKKRISQLPTYNQTNDMLTLSTPRNEMHLITT